MLALGCLCLGVGEIALATFLAGVFSTGVIAHNNSKKKEEDDNKDGSE